MRQLVHGMFSMYRRSMIRREHFTQWITQYDVPIPGILSIDETPGEPTVFAVVDFDPGDEDLRLWGVETATKESRT